MTRGAGLTTPNFWKDKRVTVTGGAGFLGSFVAEKLRERGCSQVFVPRRKDYALREREAVVQLYQDSHPDIIIHLAAAVGGIGANLKYPGRFFYENAIMGIQLIEQARLYEVEKFKFVCLGTICAYPKFTPIPFKEEALWNGYPEETNAPYDLAKKMLLVQLQAYRQQYGFNGTYLLPVNLYGPRDNFDPEYSHVIPAIIKKCVDAQTRGDKEIIAWGSGEASREFHCVEDAAEAIVKATESYDGADPVNVGSGSEISTRALVELIAKMTGFGGRIVWDRTMPDGQPRRCLDTSKAERLFGFRARTSLEDGLRKTISWYLEQREEEASHV